MSFNQYNIGHHLLCLMGPKFHASEASGSEENDNNNFLLSSMVLGRNHFGRWGHYLNNLGEGPQDNTTYK